MGEARLRLFPISDLHLERRAAGDIPRPNCTYDVLVCAGDLFEGRPEAGLAAVLDMAGGRACIVVPGNHEHYASTSTARPAPDMLAALRTEAARLRAAGAPLHLLEHGGSAVVAGGRFVGATLWSDWSLAGRWLDDVPPAERPADPVAAAAARMSDPVTGSREYLGAIRTAEGTAWQPGDAMAAHARERAEILGALARPFPGPTVAVTHHPPSPLAADAYRGRTGVPWWLPAFYASTVLDDCPPGDRPALWLSGHFHAGHDLRVGATRWLANPVEGGSFRPDLVVDV